VRQSTCQSWIPDLPRGPRPHSRDGDALLEHGNAATEASGTARHVDAAEARWARYIAAESPGDIAICWASGIESAKKSLRMLFPHDLTSPPWRTPTNASRRRPVDLVIEHGFEGRLAKCAGVLFSFFFFFIRFQPRDTDLACRGSAFSKIMTSRRHGAHATSQASPDRRIVLRLTVARPPQCISRDIEVLSHRGESAGRHPERGRADQTAVRLRTVISYSSIHQTGQASALFVTRRCTACGTAAGI